VVPTITVQDIDAERPNTASTSKAVENGAPAIPGELPAQLVPSIPDWYKVGWRQMSGIDNEPVPEGEEKDKGVLDMFLSEQFYGSWYHNAALIIFVGSPHLVSPDFLTDHSILSPGRFCFTLLNPLWIRLGLAIHYPCDM
jgi:hypothetical protein